MSACAPVGECASWRDALSATESQTSLCAMPARQRRGEQRLRLAPAQLGVRRVRRGREPCRARAPAALLDARDGDPRLRPAADEHGHVEDAVLLRADELLAVVEQDVGVERVVDRELGHRAGRVDLGDREAERERLVEA